MSPRFSPFAAWAATLAFAALPCVEAAQYTQVNATASSISFTYKQFTSRAYGTFGRFQATLDFDTQNPAAAHAALSIDLDSIDAGSSDANEELQKPAWFDTASHPMATFESSGVQALGNDHYLITGQLTLRGMTRVVEVPVQLKADDAIGIFDGQLTVKRSDFNIGDGEWADGVVSNDIHIRFRMVAPQQ